MAKKKNEETKVKKSTKTVDKTKKNNGISKINRFNILFVDLQVIFTILTIIKCIPH